jgi:hypothetical protein
MADRAERLAEFEAARTEFEEAVRRAPDAALRFKPAGEDYALGGLVVHVTDVLQRYALVLAALRDAGFSPLVAPDHVTSEADAKLIREGFDGTQRMTVLSAMREAHAQLVQNIGEDDFERKADVTYGSAGAPYPTSANDVLGWVLDHYREHITQIGDLVNAWSASTR